MIRVLAIVFAALAAASGAARADGHYVSMGGGPAAVTDELGERTDDGGGLRFAIGHRFGSWAIEGFLAPQFFGSVEGVGYGVDARYILPLTSGVQGYVRGGLSRLSLHDYGWDDESRALGGSGERAGRGLGGGVGLQLRGKVRALGFLYWPLFFVPAGPKVNAAVFVEHGVDFYRLHDPIANVSALDAKVTRVTFGFNVGGDF